MKQKQSIFRPSFLAVAFFAVMGLFLGVFAANPPQAAAAGTCYINLGDFRVGPDTSECSTDPDGRKSYRDINGNVTEPVAGHCYSGTESGSGSFATISYQEYLCQDLETLRGNARRDLCVNSGGVWNAAGTVDESTCSCPSPTSFDPASDRCRAPTEGTQDDTPSGSVPAGTIADEDSGRIVGWIQAGINLLTALAGIAITGAVIVGGIQYSTSGGNPQAAGAAKKRITNAMLAMLALVFLYTFLQWLVPGGIFG